MIALKFMFYINEKLRSNFQTVLSLCSNINWKFIGRCHSQIESFQKKFSRAILFTPKLLFIFSSTVFNDKPKLLVAYDLELIREDKKGKC